MFVKRFLSIAIFLFVLLNIMVSQNSESKSLLVQLEQGVSPKDITDRMMRENDIAGKISFSNVCRSPVSIWKFDFDQRNKNLDKLIQYLSTIDGVDKAQINHKIYLRNIPNDNKFSSQWSLNNTGQSGGTVNADIDADLAWDRTTGGVTKNGDTIVICIIDNGIDPDHEDLKDNLWINRNEIEDNGIDDDNNGYIDDYRGWNPVLGTDDIEGKSHGVSVAGIIGAKGNNEKGISGINWNIKLLIIPMSGKESDLIEAYSYVYTMRKMYNETNGQKGAFIVATNNSFGLDNSKAVDFPIWCSMYDLMGDVGVISIGATSNSNKNVDIDGDMPSTCPSDFLITVTNIDKYNKKYNSSGYGNINVDLGAFGENTFSTRPNNNYGSFGGTSAATPHVTGVLGLLYSDNKKIADNCLTHPVQTGLMVKDAILNGVIHNETLEDITVTEGVLNANESLKELDKYDDDCSPPVQIRVDTSGGDFIEIVWDDNNPEFEYNLKYKIATGDWTIINDIKSPYTLTGLERCTDYYFAIQKDCNNSQFGFITHIKTDGCCTAPKVAEYNISGNKLHIEWDKLLAANEYKINYKFWSHPVWNELKTGNNYIDLDVDFDCGQYAVSLQSVCNDSISLVSENLLFGNVCDECKENVYCNEALDNNSEWIESFSINNFSYRSGKDVSGKGDFTNSKAIKLIAGKKYTTKMKVKYESIHYDDYIFLWIDLNSDSIFSTNELVAADTTHENENIEFDFTMPYIDNIGETTLRVLLSAETKESPCDIDYDDYGEYEDYCVYLDTIPGCSTTGLNLDTVKAGVHYVELKWNNPGNFSNFYLNIKKKNSPEDKGIERFIADTTIIFNNLDSCTGYKIFLTPYCSDIETGDPEIMDIKTHCTTFVREIFTDKIRVFPNPLKDDMLFIENLDNNSKTLIDIFDSFGSRLFSKQYNNIGSDLSIRMNKSLIPGFYFIRIKQGNNYFTHKMIKL